MKFRYFVLAVVALISVPSFADRTQEAREHYQNATAHFAVGEFAEAAAEYQAAYTAKQDPALLYDAAQAYRLANNPDKALILYRNYLQLYPNEANAAEVRSQIDKLKSAIAAATRAKESPPTGTAEPKHIASAPPEPAAAAAPQVAPAVAANQATKPVDTKTSTPVYKKWWLWTVVGVVVAGGAVTAAVLATQPHGTWSNVPDVGPGSQNGRTLVRW